MYTVKICENGLQATNIIKELEAEGYTKESIYLFAHDKERSKDLTDATGTESIGLSEQGLIDSVSNVFKKRGDELRTEFENLGLSEAEAEKYERVLDGGQVVVVGSK